MPSPFPGMNPYLEQEDVWQDVHQSFIPLVREVLGAQVRPAYFVKVVEYLFIHEMPAEGRRLLGRTAVSVADSGGAPVGSERTGVLEAPAYGRLPMAVDLERHSYLEIRDRRGRGLDTVIELLSPSIRQRGVTTWPNRL